MTPLTTCNLIHDIKSSNSGGLFDISSKLVIFVNDLLAEPLFHILNRCIFEGYHPDRLKIAQVVPIFIAGDPTKPNNFRPNLNGLQRNFRKFIYPNL